MRIILFSIFSLLLSQSALSQNDDVLFTFGEDEVKVSEFLYVFDKNNINAEKKTREESINEYLDLYVNFKLKVKEAESLGLDTVQKLKRELDGYRGQLAKNYLSDDDITDKILQEAYDRSKEEVEVSHILLGLNPDASDSDTLKAYNSAMSLRSKISSTNTFEKIAQESSDDPSAKDNGGYLGYMSAFQLVYPFETGMYNTPVGSISKPVRTRYGYHLIKVTDKRAALGKITTSHILIKTSKGAPEAAASAAKTTIDAIHSRLTSGQSTFETEAKKYSQDRATASKGGLLPEVGSGVMYEEFEKAAFALENDGDISEPVQTEIGWHIIKRIQLRKIGDFNSAKLELKKKVEKDSRAAVPEEKFINRLKKEYNFRQNASQVSSLINGIDPKVTSFNWVPDEKIDQEKSIFSFAGQDIKAKAFIDYLRNNRPSRSPRDKDFDKIIERVYGKFVSKTILDYEDTQLEKKYPDFKRLMKEYRDGILLFELTDNKIWSYAVKDTVGLNQFFEENNANYMWEERVDATMLSYDSSADIPNKTKLLKWLAKGKLSKIEKKFPSVNVKTAKYEKGSNERIDATNWEKGVHGPETWDNEAVIIKVNGMVEPELKKLSDSKGYVVADYQTYLEKQWIEKLKNKYPISINSDVLKSLY